MPPTRPASPEFGEVFIHPSMTLVGVASARKWVKPFGLWRSNTSTVRSRTHLLPSPYVRHRPAVVKFAATLCAGSFTICNQPLILRSLSRMNPPDSAYRSILPWSEPTALQRPRNFIEPLAHFNSDGPVWLGPA